MKALISALAAVWLASAFPASAESLSVLADPLFEPALTEIAPLFTERTGFDVAFTFLPSDRLDERIGSDAQADLVFPASELHMNRLMAGALVDVALKRNIVVLPAPPPDPNASAELQPPPSDPQYASAAVLIHASHRVPAMAFLEFLASPEARSVFQTGGFGLP